MNQKKSIDVDKLNEHIIKHASNAMQHFCEGTFKEAYPDVATRIHIASPDRVISFDMGFSLAKDKKGMLKDLGVFVIHINN